MDDLGQRALALSSDLIGIDSANPTLVPGAVGEHHTARFIRDRLAGAGFVTWLIGSVDRPSLMATYEGGTGPSVVLNGHLDTVGVDGMPGAFEPRVIASRLHWSPMRRTAASGARPPWRRSASRSSRLTNGYGRCPRIQPQGMVL